MCDHQSDRMNDYLSKPLHPQSLQRVLFQWIKRPNVKLSSSIVPANKTSKETGIPDFGELKIPAGLNTFDLQNSPPGIAKKATLYLKLLKMYLDDKEQYSEKLRIQAKASDTQALKDTVHSIKGLSGNLGIVKVFEYAKTVEAEIKQTGDIPQDATEDLILLMQQSFKDIELILKANT